MKPKKSPKKLKIFPPKLSAIKANRISKEFDKMIREQFADRDWT